MALGLPCSPPGFAAALSCSAGSLPLVLSPDLAMLLLLGLLTHLDLYRLKFAVFCAQPCDLPALRVPPTSGHPV